MMSIKNSRCQARDFAAPLFISSLLALLIAQLFAASPARAEQCEYEGQKYDPGESVGPLLCLPDGSWQING
jgi:hypothetical protein